MVIGDNMAAELTNYVLQERPIQPMIDLGIMQNTLATITAGNKEALQKQSELRAAIAKLDLNEAEDGYKQQLYDDITKTIDDNAIEGNAYFALDDIIKKAGDIHSNQGLIGRINAQQAYKTFEEELKQRVLKNDISQDTADWAKELNPYHYEDTYKVDEQGNPVLDEKGSPIVIGGTRWTPNFTPVKDIDFNDVFDAITKELQADSNQWDSPNAFIYEDGTTGSKFIPSKTVDYLSQSAGGYVRLTPEKIRSAIQNAFQNNPQLAVQAKQAWDVLNWKADKGEITPDNNGEVFSENGVYNGQGGLFNKDGSRKSYNDYIIDMVDGYARTHQYNRTTSSVKYNSAGMRDSYDRIHQFGRYKQSGSSGSSVDRQTANMTYNGVLAGKYKASLSNFSSNAGQYAAVQSAVLNSLAGIGINLDKMPKSPEEFLALRSKVNSEEGLKVFDNTYKMYKDNYDAYRGEFEHIDNFRTDEEAAWEGVNDVLQTLGSSRSLNELADSKNVSTQQFMKDWSKIVDNSFGTHNVLVYKAKSKQALDKIVSELGGVQSATDAGYHISGNTISIDKDHSYLLYNLNSAIGGIPGKYLRADEFDGKTVGMWRSHENPDSPAAYYHGMRVAKNDFYDGSGDIRKAIDRFGTNAQAFSDAAKVSRNDNGESIVEVPYYITDGANPAEIELRSIKELVGEEAYKRMYDEAVQRFENNKNLDFTNVTIRRRVGTSGDAIPVDDATKKEIVEKFKYSKSGEGVYQPYVARVEGIGLLPGCRFSVKTGSGDKATTEYYDIVLDDPSADNDMVRYNRTSSIVRNESSTIYNWNENIPIYLGRSLYGEIYVDPIKESQTYQWVGTINGNPTNFVITNHEAAALRMAYTKLIMQRDDFVTTLLSQPTETEQAIFAKEYVDGFIEENPKIKALFDSYDDIYNYVMLNLKR